MNAQWQPIATAPRDGRNVIVGYENGAVWIVRSAWYAEPTDWCPPREDGIAGWWSYIHCVTQELLHEDREPTHWLPLPRPPDGDV